MLLCQQILSSQSYGFTSNYVWMWELDHKESWMLKNWCFWTVVLEKTLESALDCREIQPVNPKGNQSWIFIERTDAEAETPILWLSDAKSWLTWKLLWFACECGSPPWAKGLRGHCHWITTSKQLPSESALHIKWPQYWSFRFSISPSNVYSDLISFRMEWLRLLVI